MPRLVRCSIIQASTALPATEPLAVQKKAMIEKHLGLIRKAAADGAQIVCLQEIFNGPYFCAEQSTRWYETTEPVPDGSDLAMGGWIIGGRHCVHAFGNHLPVTNDECRERAAIS